ncbi:Leucine-rich repeat [Arabidopsis thaliana x Arabidopsis arenosa]|uniref:Leucine-rich repeat n=1 Tax=Arabidopsis thaliana x Arabidopsis arenosa TaxID=1240361 RepID=A0A8T1Y7R9_9BRAS|nr:Leucine-rich repeat [Arabidopsis thaliana x Arabidopsis arenosa]
MTSMRYLHVFILWGAWCHIIISLCCEASARKDGSPLHCTDLSSPQWTNISLFNESTLHLLSLQLSSANLTGSFPREIGEFSLLQNVFLNMNSLSGSIPLGLGYASSLSEIDLSRNNISGVLPPSIWNLCDKLVSFRVHECLLFGDFLSLLFQIVLVALDFGGFPEFITKLKGLNELDLSSNMFESIVLERLTLLKLEKLNLSDNNFTGEGKRGEKLHIYDYLPNRSLQDLMHESKPGRLVLNWARRHKIALGIARDSLIFTPDKKFL